MTSLSWVVNVNLDAIADKADKAD